MRTTIKRLCVDEILFKWKILFNQFQWKKRFSRKTRLPGGEEYAVIAFWEEGVIRKRRTKEDYAEFMKNVADRSEIIRVVQDPNTHSGSQHSHPCFLLREEPEEAGYLCKKIEFHYTPKKLVELGRDPQHVWIAGQEIRESLNVR